MSHRALGHQFDLSITHLRDMISGDYGSHMDQVHRDMQENWDSGDPDRAHGNDAAHGGFRPYLDHLKADISKNGVTTPILVRGNTVHEGHHRAVAAMELGLRAIPARETPR